MASNKESMVIILDVGIGADELTRAACKCTLNVIKKKIFNYKIDMLSLLLLRTEETDNDVNAEEPDQYLNICKVLPGSQIPTWDMAKEFMNSLNKPRSKDGDWVDALIIAIGIINSDASIHKTRISKIVLFHNFNSTLSSLDDAIVDKLNEMDIQLIIVSDNIHYIPNAEGELQPQFITKRKKSQSQCKNEELALKLRTLYPATTLCNFNDALPIILSKKLPRPWSWNATLAIGSQIVIHVSGVIAIKEDAGKPDFHKNAKGSNEVIKRDKKHYAGVDELTEDMPDLISAYMLGNTPMPYDPSLGQAPHVNTKKGVYFIGFVPSKNIPQEHFSGSSTYVLFAAKDKLISAQIMNSLVIAMLKNDPILSILAWKVYNNSNKPKLVVLVPTLEHKVAGLSMIELSYHSQHRFWDFPKLNTKKNTPTPDQIAAIDDLMASMELCPDHDLVADPNPSMSLTKDYMPFEFLPNIRQQLFIDFMAKSILEEPVNKTSENLAKISERFQPDASVAVEKIKQLFKLEKIEITTKEKLKKHFFNDDEDAQDSNNPTTSTALDEDFKVTHVGSVTPAEDFKSLITNIVSRMSNGAERAAKFHQYACQMREVISDLLFKSMTKQNEKIQKALATYRKLTIAANSSYDYNDWMKEIRSKVIERKMFDFWKDVIVKEQLGLCMEEDAQVESEFYDVSKEIATSNVNELMEDDESVEDLFGNM